MKESKDNVNPFSFKKFLQTGPQNSTSRANSGGATGTNSLTTLDLANDLPDFVQDRGSTRDKLRYGQSDPVSFVGPSLPDFALDSAGHRLGPQASSDSDSDVDNRNCVRNDRGVPPLDSDHSEASHSSRKSGNSAKQPFVDAQNDDDEDDDDDSFNVPNATGGLPDFLSDSAIGGTSSMAVLDRTDPELFHNGFRSGVDSREELKRVGSVVQ